MLKIDWLDNDGHCYSEPGEINSVECGVCGANMDVTRNLFGSTSMAEAVSGGKHRYDAFVCPHKEELWHRKIYKLKSDVYNAKIDDDPFYDEIKSDAEWKILELLNINKAR